MTRHPEEGRIHAIATRVADRCHGSRKAGDAPVRYAMIWQAARLGAIETLNALVDEMSEAPKPTRKP